MKKVALTALVLALGLVACTKKTETTVDNNSVTTENTVAVDANAAVDAGNAADNALDATGNAVDNTVVTDNEVAANNAM